MKRDREQLQRHAINRMQRCSACNWIWCIRPAESKQESKISRLSRVANFAKITRPTFYFFQRASQRFSSIGKKHSRYGIFITLMHPLLTDCSFFVRYFISAPFLPAFCALCLASRLRLSLSTEYSHSQALVSRHELIFFSFVRTIEFRFSGD